MDRVLRNYAHTAWTPADPLAGLEPDVRRAILLMPSTFRERWKLAPWTGEHQRRLAIADIVAERRLLYELTHQNVAAKAPSPTREEASPSVEPSSPYYRYRLALRQQTLGSVLEGRSEQDRLDVIRVPEARADHDRRLETRRQALLAIEIERARLEVRELEILAGDDPVPVRAKPKARSKLPGKQRQRGRAR